MWVRRVKNWWRTVFLFYASVWIKVFPDIFTLSPFKIRDYLKKSFMVYNIYLKNSILVMLWGVEQRKISVLEGKSTRHFILPKFWPEKPKSYVWDTKIGQKIQGFQASTFPYASFVNFWSSSHISLTFSKKQLILGSDGKGVKTANYRFRKYEFVTSNPDDIEKMTFKITFSSPYKAKMTIQLYTYSKKIQNLAV